MFPAVGHHYKDLLYGAYKSSNPVEYLMEFLEPYKDTLERRQLLYLVRFLVNREQLRESDTMKMILKEEQQTLPCTPQLLLSRFIFYSTAICHVWHRGDEGVAYRHCLDPTESKIICYFEPNKPLSYMWLDVNIAKGSMRLIKSNITHMSDYVVKSLWKWTDGGSHEIVTKTYTFDVATGDTYEELSGGHSVNPFASAEVPVVRLAVDGESGRVGLTQELGLRHEWPFVVLFTYTDNVESFIFSKILYNTRDGHVLPLLCSMHSLQ